MRWKRNLCNIISLSFSNFEKISENYNEKIVKYPGYQQFKQDHSADELNRDKKFGANYFDLIEGEIIEDERKITELLESYANINESLENLIEKKSVFDKTSQLLLSGAELNRDKQVGEPSMFAKPVVKIDEEISHRSDLNFIAGVIKGDDDLRMKRMIFRISKGRAIPTFFDLVTVNRLTKLPVLKKIFTIFFQGGVENILLDKLLKVCDIFGASRFNIPRREEIQSQINQLQNEIYEKKTFLKQAETSIKDFLKDKIGFQHNHDIQYSKYDMYRIYFKKEKLIFTNLNKCILRGNFIDGEVWVPVDKVKEVAEALKNVGSKSELNAFFTDPDHEQGNPPTYIKTNEFTAAFQQIVDTYGVPRYGEVNPTLFNIVSFPFLFGVMFGDIGHGFLLSLFGLYLIIKCDELRKNNSPLKAVLKGRYLLFFMGFCAFYAGWIYNDFLSVPLGIFGTCYTNPPKNNHHAEMKAMRKPGCVYPFGVDPKWYVSSNELAFMNSMKMKFSVIIGVSQMVFGIIMKGMNSIYFKNYVDFIFEFIPQIIFMTLLFGYMCIMIFIKWATDWSHDTSKAPSILSQLMMIFLNGGSVGPEVK